MDLYEREQARLEHLMEVVSTDDEEQDEKYDDSESEGEIDFVEERVAGSESEEDISDHEAGPTNSAFFIGKDKKTKWKKHLPPKGVRTRSENKVLRLPISRLGTRSLKNHKDIFKFFIDDEMLNILIENTNAYIESIAYNFERDRDAKPTDAIEMQACLGVLLYAGVMKANRLNVEELWRSDGSGVEIFRLAMSIKRFLFLLRCLRFDRKETREARKSVDKLAPIRELFDLFVNKCKTGYSLSEYVTIDEKLEGFRGKCSFRQYIPSKPNRYGIKIFALSDAKTFYTSNLEVYVGLQPDGPYKESNSPDAVVVRLCDVIKNSGRNLTLDNWFTSVPLVETLLKDFKLTVIGTIRKNKRELPVEFSSPTHRVGASMFGFTKNCTIVSYIPKKKCSFHLCIMTTISTNNLESQKLLLTIIIPKEVWMLLTDFAPITMLREIQGAGQWLYFTQF